LNKGVGLGLCEAELSLAILIGSTFQVRFAPCEVFVMRTTVLAVIGSVLFSLGASLLFACADEAVTSAAPHQDAVPQAGNSPDKNSVNTSADQERLSELTIASGDLLEVSLFGTDFSCGANKTGCEVRVDGSGSVTLPLIGPVRVGGLNVTQAEQVIAARLSEGGFFNNPQVTIIQKEYATQGISVLGEVQKPGIYSLLGSHTMLQAISAAGGTTVKAGNDVRLIRADHPHEPQHVDLSSQTSLQLMPGDTIVVSKAGIVYVVGDVHLPAGVVMESSGLTVLKAIAMAQGTNATASLDKAKLIRNTPGGRQEIPISLRKILSNKAADLELQPEDILFIPSSAAKSATRRGLEAILQMATGVAIYRRN
jgi:polysaccharide export outer membrane protein